MSGLGLLKAVSRIAVLGLLVASVALPSRSTPPISNPVYVSTHQGGQILVVDGDTGVVSVLFSSSCDGGTCPEGIVVGPDNKIYMADPTSGTIRRIDRSGANLETLITSCVVSPCPTGPQAPSFSSSPAGDLYFVDPGSGNTNDVFVIAGAAKTAFGGTFSNPAVVLQNCGSGSPFCEHVLGRGTAFDTLDNLLFDDTSSGTVWSSPPPYNVASALVALANVPNPGAIALNKNTGQVFVANAAGQILSINISATPPNTTTTYYTFASPDIPQYMQFDAAGRLFVTTAQSTTFPYHGKVWRVDPPVSPSSSPTATLLVDLNSIYGDYLNTDQADGLALPPTSYPAISILLNPNGGTNRYTFGAFDLKIVYGPPTPPNLNINLVLQAFQETQPQLDAFTTGTPFAGATLAPYAGTGGYGIRFVATCQDATATTLLTIPCPQFLDPYEVVTNYNGVLPSNVAFLTDEDSGPYLLNILTSYSALRTGDPTVSGHKVPVLSGFQVVGGVTGTPPTIAITSPTNNATYTLNQLVLANYTCAGAYVITCAGTVANGTQIDTASVGTKTFTVTALTSSGPTAFLTVTYTVIAGGPVASVSPSSVNFGNVKVGHFAERVVTLTNTGTAPMKITNVKIVPVKNGDSDDFSVFSRERVDFAQDHSDDGDVICPKTLAVGKSCSIWVSFYADANNFNPSATLTITDNAPGSPQKIPLTATVVKSHAGE